jgi:hypothetical protein
VPAKSVAMESGSEKRRTTRVVQAVPIVVHGMDALGQTFKESTTTVMVNCNGCKYRSRHYVPKDSRVTLEIRAVPQGRPPRMMAAHVVWVQRPRTFREIFHVALEFDVAGNVWNLQSPPEDWFPHPEDLEAEAAAPAAAESAPGEPGAAQTAPEQRDGGKKSPEEVLTPAASTKKEPAADETAPATAKRPAWDHRRAGQEWGFEFEEEGTPELAAARAMVTPAVRAAMGRQMSRLRERLATHLRESLGSTIQAAAQSIAEAVEKEIVERAAARTAEIVVEARKACQIDADQLNERIQHALREAIRALDAGESRAERRKRRRKGRKEEATKESEPEPVGTK